VREQCRERNIGWIVEAEVSGCFDKLDHGLVRDIMRKRVNDGSILRLIGQWRHAGVREGDNITYPEKGTPQGGDRIDPCGVPVTGCSTPDRVRGRLWPSVSSTPALSHFLLNRRSARSSMRSANIRSIHA